jgi:hypothetical protein
VINNTRTLALSKVSVQLGEAQNICHHETVSSVMALIVSESAKKGIDRFVVSKFLSKGNRSENVIRFIPDKESTCHLVETVIAEKHEEWCPEDTTRKGISPISAVRDSSTIIPRIHNKNHTIAHSHCSGS